MADTETAVDPAWPESVDARMGRLGKATMEVTIVMGRSRLPLEDVMNLRSGSVVELDRVNGQPVDILVNGELFARGEVVVVSNHIAIRICDFLRPENMVTT